MDINRAKIRNKIQNKSSSYTNTPNIKESSMDSLARFFGKETGNTYKTFGSFEVGIIDSIDSRMNSTG